MNDDIYLTISTDGNGRMIVVDQNGRKVHGVTFIEHTAEVGAYQKATTTFFCYNTAGETILNG